METQSKTKIRKSFFLTSCATLFIISLSACSFVELNRGAENIIFSRQGDDCKQIKTFTAQVKTTTLFIDRRPEAIAEELQILAQNEAYAEHANAIWPISDIEEGMQTFDILRCDNR